MDGTLNQKLQQVRLTLLSPGIQIKRLEYGREKKTYQYDREKVSVCSYES
jgi:hypothetical protein